MIEIRHLRTLLTLMETGSLTAAASRLHLTQSALSHQIKELEERLGISLINRASRPVRLTQGGRRLADLAERVLPQVDQAIAGIRALARGQSGRLIVASECHSCLEWLLPRLRWLREHFPGVELDVAPPASLDLLPHLSEGTVDVVFTPDRREVPGLAWTKLFDYALKLAVASGHRLATRPYVVPDDLREETLLVYPVERSRLDVFTRFLWQAGTEPRRVRPIDGTTLLLELAALDQGVAVLPDWSLSAAVASGRIAALQLGRTGLAGSLYACVREAEVDLPHLATFVRICAGTAAAEAVAEHPGPDTQGNAE